MAPRDDDLRTIIDAGMRAAVPDERTRGRMLAGVLAQIPAPVPPASTGGDAATGGAIAATSGGLKLVVGAIVALVAVGVIGGIAITRPGTSDDTAPRATNHHQGVREPTQAPAGVPAALIEEPAIALPTTPVARPLAPSIDRDRSPEPTHGSVRNDVVPATSPIVPAPPSTASPDDALDLAAEAELVAQARAALERGDTDRALVLTARHAAQHPAGQLSVEREAIAVVAACVADKPTAADGARRFLASHPRQAAAASVRARCVSELEDDARAEIDRGP